MYLVHLFLVLLCLYESQPQQYHFSKKFNVEENVYSAVTRLLELMRYYYEEANSRIYQLNSIRFMYEESPYYEMGYIIGEIIERYRKVLEMAQRPQRFQWYAVPDTLKLVEYTQKLYFELYHLVRMLHETPRKWVENGTSEFMNIEKVAGADAVAESVSKVEKPHNTESDITHEMSLKELHMLKKTLAEKAIVERKAKKEYKKKMAKLRQAYLEGVVREMKMLKKKSGHKWPIEYGWEIGTYW